MIVANRSKTYADTTVPPSSGRFAEIVRAMLATAPAPAGDPSTRKKKTKKSTRPNSVEGSRSVQRIEYGRM